MDHFDLVVIGAGAAGLSAAKTAAELGARVALADRGPLGGLSVNRGCLPKKALVTAGRAHRLVREGGGLGTRTSGVSLDWPAVQRPAGAYADFGSRVTVLARDPEILPALEPDLARVLRKAMAARGVVFRSSSSSTRPRSGWSGPRWSPRWPPS